jgi:thymidylate synthase ThyX
MYKAEILADSINPQGDRITTMKITFPRMMLAEFNTHRMFSKNSASSRAIPFKKMVKMVENNPFIPIAWQKDHKGMQGTEYFTNNEMPNNIEPDWFKTRWLEARDSAVKQAIIFNKAGVTKQLCNRLLEPFMWHTVICTFTETENFFKLRCPLYYGKFRSWKDASNLSGATFETPFINRQNESQADIHIQAIAELMWDTMNESTPKQLQAGEWHIPFGDNISDGELHRVFDNKYTITQTDIDDLKVKIAVARCARISYETLGDNPKIDYEADIRLHDMLLKSGHYSPFEHVARAMSDEEYDSFINGEDYHDLSSNFNIKNKGWCRNFRGFIQYRHLIDNNNG